ncbi:MAG: AAA family ATPase [Acidobacteria bacterium]|nr:MAG: AAA family ATPase [Acidobacteriota bacterium]
MQEIKELNTEAQEQTQPKKPGRRRKPRSGKQVVDDLSLLLEVLPPRVREALRKEPEIENLVEVVMDLGRMADARFFGKDIRLNDIEVTPEDLEYVVKRVGSFTGDNRAGIERTLHRISALRNRRQQVIGLTCRVGRAVTGTVDIIRDVIETGKSILLLGPPGVGKTTLLREAARVLADDFNKRVIVVDTSNEIAGDGDVPHPGIGSARRMQVPAPELQHQVMIEAVENHMPEVIVIDEIGTLAEALAARTIAERGVQLVATAHGINLDNLLSNPTLSDLVGGVQVVTLSDEEARRRGTRKSVLERKAPPTFDILVEIHDRNQLAIYHDISRVVDRFLSGSPLRPENRLRGADGSYQVEPPAERVGRRGEVFERPGPGQPAAEPPAAERSVDGQEPSTREKTGREGRRHSGVTRIYPIGVSRIRLEKSIRELRVPARLADQPIHADVILSLKAQRKREPKKLREALDDGVDFRTIKSNTSSQIRSFLSDYFGAPSDGGEERRITSAEDALHEAEDAIVRVMRNVAPVELAPQNAYVRRLQHELVYSHGLVSESKGRPPYRRVVVYPTES